ncbi:MAG: nucleoside-diphosphate sugar epimerase/dehydratase [Victivallaceae bacterium]|nr:nucleoside-diphosphate sugar epimerase/dehydratase [Victivallaceae bacterium]
MKRLLSQENLLLQLRKMRWLPLDFIALCISYFFSLVICCNLDVNSAAFANGVEMFRQYGLQFVLLSLLMFAASGLYRGIWAYAGLREVGLLMAVNLLNICVEGILVIFFLRDLELPVGLYVLLFFSNIGFMMLPRMALRVLRAVRFAIAGNGHSRDDATLVIGAGMAGKRLVSDIARYADVGARPVCFIDDDKNKHGLSMSGVPVYGGRDKIMEAVKRFQVKNIILDIPSAPAEEKRALLEICSRTGCKMFTVPSLQDILENKVSLNKLRNVDIADLLGREETRLNMDQVHNFLTGKVILVTGGGGSIGSELCRQIAGFQPKLLIIFDIYENNAYDLQQELKCAHPDLEFKVLIGSVRDINRLDEVFSAFRPEVVFHAAAHKHVPLMEESPKEAIKNNVFGTYNTGITARKYGAKRFVLISTDKAVNPTNVMGASKRLCEMVVQSLNQPGNTEFAAVRFGNVLGSNGSVIPLFKRLIATGRPLPVTHPEIVRYFMTIPEAARLVLQAGAIAHGGEIFILDMGQPVKIVDLAENLIRLSGLKPYEDIKIEFCGLRPGEKLYEELSLAEEGQDSTAHEKIFISHQLPFDYSTLLNEQLSELGEILIMNNEQCLRDFLKRTVTTYHPGKQER